MELRASPKARKKMRIKVFRCTAAATPLISAHYLCFLKQKHQEYVKTLLKWRLQNLFYGPHEFFFVYENAFSLSSTVLEQGTSFLACFSVHFILFVCLCVCVPVSCAKVSSVLGQSSSFSSETGAAHPDGPPSQPHTLHRSQVTNGNRLQLCVTDALALISLCFHLMPQPPSAVTLQRTFSFFFC